MHRLPITKDDHGTLQRCLLLIEAFRAIRRTMPLQHAYAFLLVASEEGHSVSEYAKRAGTTQAVMTRILFALSSRKRESGDGLVQQVIDPQDGRRTQTFLTAKGNALVREIVRLVRSDRQRGMKLRKFDDNGEATTKFGTRSVALPLIAAGLKLGADDIQLVIRQVETLIGHRQSNRSPRPHDASTNRRRYR
jgi:DNA-binding MarR family transcriptional regulator